MDPFPFTERDWQRVSDAARAVVNATFADDLPLSASYLIELLDLLAELRKEYGDHPVLLETEGDFLDEPELRITAYEHALRIAEHEGLPTLTIRISMARVLIEDFGDTVRARDELATCRREMMQSVDASERREWRELMNRCA
jgi:hypothetical protein